MRALVAFISPKRSAKTIEVAAQYTRSCAGTIHILKVIPDPKKVGVVAELISSNYPMQKATIQINEVVEALQKQGLNASGEVRIGSVAKTIVSAANELSADMVFVGTREFPRSRFSPMPKDPIVHYLVDHCPLSICLVRTDYSDNSNGNIA